MLLRVSIINSYGIYADGYQEKSGCLPYLERNDVGTGNIKFFIPKNFFILYYISYVLML